MSKYRNMLQGILLLILTMATCFTLAGVCNGGSYLMIQAAIWSHIALLIFGWIYTIFMWRFY